VDFGDQLFALAVIFGFGDQAAFIKVFE